MRNVLFSICAIAFFTVGLASVVHADVPNMACSHHASDVDRDCASDKMQDHDETEQCQDCCCIHSHVFTGTVTDVSANNTFKDSIDLSPNSPLQSNDHSPLYRPPIV